MEEEKCVMYKIYDTHKKADVETGFAERELAKPKRDELNGGKPNGLTMARYIISRDEAHPFGPSNGVSKKMRGKNSRF